MTQEPALLRLALRLYPAAYRRERGAEIAAVYADATAGGGAFAAGRELFGIAGYGLRQRSGLTFGGQYGEVVARAAPLTVGFSAGLPLFMVAVSLAYGFVPASFEGMVALGQGALALLSLAAVLGGYWGVARGLALLTVVGVPAGVLAELVRVGIGSVRPWVIEDTLWFTVPSVLAALLVLAAPPDLLRRRSWRQGALVSTALLLGSLTVTTVKIELVWSLVLMGLPLLVLGVRSGRLLLGAFCLAALPVVLVIGVDRMVLLAHGGQDLLSAGTGAVLAVGVVLVSRLRRPADPATSLPPTTED